MCPQPGQCHCLEEQHLLEINLSLNLSINLSLNLSISLSLSLNPSINLSPNPSLSLSLSLSPNHNLSLLQYQTHMGSELGEPLHQIHPQTVTQYPTMESSLNLDTQQAWEMGYPTTQVHPLCASDVERTIIQMLLQGTESFLQAL